MTRLVRLDGQRPSYLPPEVVSSVREGGMVIFPTDTLYGLGVDPLSESGVARLMAAKGRAPGKAVPLLLSDPKEAHRWVRGIPEAASRLMARFWPGALTIVLPARSGLLPAITGGGETVGLRVPDHPVPRMLARGLSGAVTGTSANRSGIAGAWESAEEVAAEFAGEVDWILWSGKAAPAAGAGSTVVDMTGGRPVLLRQGVVPFADVAGFLGKE